MIYVTKRCPNCGYIYQNHQAGEQRSYGCPYQKCPVCNSYYWDSDIKEPALHGYENSYETFSSIRRFILCMVLGTIGLIFIGLGLYISDPKMLVVCLIICTFMLWPVFAYIKQCINNKKKHSEIIAFQQMEYDASKKRLQNTEYLKALAKVLYDKRAIQLYQERINGEPEHYAKRPTL